MLTDFLPFFRGSLDHTLRFELERKSDEREPGQPYTVGNQKSGVILDCGHDLAYEPFVLTEELFGDHLNQLELLTLRGITGISGVDAERTLEQSTILADIRIPEEAAEFCLIYKMQPIWKQCLQRWPDLASEDTPIEVQEAVLDIAFRRGSMNRHLRAFDYPIRNAKWGALAEAAGEMLNRSSDEEQRARQKFFQDLIIGEDESNTNPNQDGVDSIVA